MKHTLIWICGFLLPGLVTGQNLVPNFSFEEYKTCDFIHGAIDTNFISPPVIPGWCSGTFGGTPDYFNLCQLPPMWSGDNRSVPLNAAGYQNAFLNGNAYAGINHLFRFSPTVEAREYLQSKLKQELTKGKSYCAGYFTSFANQDSNVVQSKATLVAPLTWGMYLSPARPFNPTVPSSTSPPTTFYLPGTPQITTGAAITDTANWVLVSGVFTAAGAEEWLTIGNFNPIGQTILDTFYNAHDYAVSSYYYIDNVFVIPMDDGGLLPEDTALCASSFPFQLKAFDGFTNYLWGSGDTTLANVITGPGTYTISANYEGCLIVDTITIGEFPASVLELDTARFCENSLPANYTLPDSTGFSDFTWTDGTTGPAVSISGPGTLMVVASGNCGADTAELVVVIDPELVLDIGQDRSICEESQLVETVLQNAVPLPGYTWSTGETTPEITVSLPGVYILRTSNTCGVFMDEIELTGCAPKVYVPNVFYPGSLYAENNHFKPFAVNAEIVEFKVFNRWGGLVYAGEGDNAAWDGTHKGTACSPGVYAYFVRYEGSDGMVRLQKGEIILMR